MFFLYIKLFLQIMNLVLFLKKKEIMFSLVRSYTHSKLNLMVNLVLNLMIMS